MKICRNHPIIIVRLRGGLGNQLFQYAMGRSLSVINNGNLLIDISAYTHNQEPNPLLGIRQLGLSHFNIAGKFINYPEYLNKSRLNRLIYKYVMAMDAKKPYYLRHHIIEPNENHFIFDENLYKRKIHDYVVLEGYWQTEKFFLNISELLRTELTVNSAPDEANTLLAKTIQATNSVCIHVRHGDNARSSSPGLGVLPLAYYNQAVSLLNKKISNPHYFIFSDDHEWTKNFVNSFNPITFVDINNDIQNYEDLRLMSMCKHHIIANSTFSWWGAWLANQPGQIVYTPRRYYQSLDRPNPDLYPESWHTL